MSLDAISLITACAAAGAAGDEFSTGPGNDVFGAAVAVGMLDYWVSGFQHYSGTPDAPGVTTYPSPHTFDVYLELVRGPKAYLIQNRITSGHFNTQDATLGTHGATYAQTVTCDHDADTDHTITIHVQVTVTGYAHAVSTIAPVLTYYDGVPFPFHYAGDTAGGHYSLNGPGMHGSDPWSAVAPGGVVNTGTVEIQAQAGVATWAGSGGTTDYFLQWLLSSIDNGSPTTFSPALYTSQFPFRQDNVQEDASAYVFKWYSDAGYTTLLATTALLEDTAAVWATNSNGSFTSPYLRATRDGGATWITYGAVGGWIDPRTDI